MAEKQSVINNQVLVWLRNSVPKRGSKIEYQGRVHIVRQTDRVNGYMWAQPEGEDRLVGIACFELQKPPANLAGNLEMVLTSNLKKRQSKKAYVL
jgi:hypothetical protein